MTIHSIEAVHEGGCACGAFRFRAMGKPIRVGMCHCETCRRVHGSAFGAYAIYRRDQVEMSGTLATWRSSDEGRRHFCPVCGSVAYMEFVSRPELDLPLGAFDETGLFEPDYELWCKHREPWLQYGARPEYEEERTA
ncbi:Gfa-like protein [Candidatus Burkholderia verschuerenii]|uniref:Gfa-like protein n=1 Tax=Candidatus Burkholderia verschuerenii TaxID=242163 RepID=A0A0L0M5L5_9BURK|nr:GFA family protein [Candidatus Burkholderia verschuerenii]KND57560.1 Gfa-like protein [Candidatus Burkholderia verschuerenii]